MNIESCIGLGLVGMTVTRRTVKTRASVYELDLTEQNDLGIWISHILKLKTWRNFHHDISESLGTEKESCHLRGLQTTVT